MHNEAVFPIRLESGLCTEFMAEVGLSIAWLRRFCASFYVARKRISGNRAVVLNSQAPTMSRPIYCTIHAVAGKGRACRHMKVFWAAGPEQDRAEHY